MLDFIEHVVYINLEHRKDRRAHIEAQLACFGSRVERFNAIYDEMGGIGCTKSHIAVLERAKKEQWKNVLIVEDDFEWKNLDEGTKCLNELITNPYDVILFAGAIVREVDCRLLTAETTTCYLVQNHYYDKILTNFYDGLERLKTTKVYYRYAIDQHWKWIMKKDKWLIVKPALGTQRIDYSDIDKTIKNYDRNFF